MEGVTVYRGILHDFNKVLTEQCKLITPVSLANTYRKNLHKISCILTQQDVVTLLNSQKQVLHCSIVCTNKVNVKSVELFLPWVHSTIYSVEPVWTVNRCPCENDTAAMITDWDEAFNMLRCHVPDMMMRVLKLLPVYYTWFSQATCPTQNKIQTSIVVSPIRTSSSDFWFIL